MTRPGRKRGFVGDDIAPSSSRRFLNERRLLGTVLVLLAALLAWSLIDDHRRVTALEGERLAVQARVIDDNVVRQLEGANAALMSVSQDLREAAPLVASAGTEKQLKLLTAAMPGVTFMTVHDQVGTVIASSRMELLGKNFRHRDYFSVAERSADPSKLYVSPPFRSSLGPFVMVVSRALTDAHGHFIGVVTATLDPDYFAVVLRSVLYAPDMRTALIHGDGKVFLNMPLREAALGQDLSATDTLFRQHMMSGEQASIAAGPAVAVGDERLMALRTINQPELRLNRSLVVAVGRDAAEIYRAWRGRALWLSLFWLVIGAGSISVLVTSQRRRQAAGQAAIELARIEHAASERVELALRGADLGLWDLRLPDGHVVVSSRERELLGYAEGEQLPSGEAWRQHVHPEDRAHVDASIVPHLLGQAPNYECEHRIRRRDGSYVWVSNRAMIVERDAAGAPTRVVGTHLDITERKRVDAELRSAALAVKSSEEQLRQVADNMPALVSRFDAEQRFRFVNRAYGDWLGIDPATLLGKTLVEVYGESAYGSFRHHVERALAGERVVYERDFRTLAVCRRVEVTLVPQNDPVTGFGVYALIVDITERHRAEARLRRLAEIDALTGLPNRTLFEDRLVSAMRSAADGKESALLFVDVDRFKSINDTLGHEAGDQLLTVFARRMQQTVRPTDTVARLGGDEFTIILEGLRDASDASIVAANLIEVLREPIKLGEQSCVVTASIGLTVCEPGETDERALLRRADAALYEAKRRGRNGYYCHTADSSWVTAALK